MQDQCIHNMFLFTKKQQLSQEQPKPFKQLFNYQQRVQRRLKYESKYTKQKCALIVIEGLNQFGLQGPDYFIFGVQHQLSALLLMEYIRSKFSRQKQRQSFFLKVKTTVIKTTQKIGLLYKKYADDDGFLYVEVRSENVF